jgi:predicted secreted protein
MKNIQAEETEKKTNIFMEMASFTKGGKVKSAFLVYSFTAAILFGIFYFVFFMLFVDPIDLFLQKFNLPVAWMNIFENWGPALLASVFCNGIYFLVKDKRIIPGAYIWLLLLAFLSIVYVQFSYDAESLEAFWYFFFMLIPPPLVTGSIISGLIYARYLKNEKKRKMALDNLPKELPPWKRKISN